MSKTKLTPAQRNEAARLHMEDGVSITKVARRYKVTPPNIHGLIKRRKQQAVKVPVINKLRGSSMTKREMILKFLEENPTGTYAMFGKDKGVARQYFDSTKRAAQINSSASVPEQIKPFDELKTLETLEDIVDRVISSAGKKPELIRLRREIGGMILKNLSQNND